MITLKDTLEEELSLVENYISFLDSRRTGGILYIPEELTSADGEGYASDESLEQVLLETMLEAVNDRTSAASLVPIIVRGPAEYHDKIRHIDLDREFYSSLCERAYNIKAQIREIDNNG